MAHTYRDIVYAIFDECKVISDDALLEVEHVIHICHKYRGLLFTQKYKGKKVEIPFAYYQRLNVYFDTSYSDGSTYQSFKRIPNILDITNLWQYTFVHNDGMRSENLNLINPQRFKNVGYNKWLRNQVYITIDLDNYMYARSPGSNIDNATPLVGEADITTSELKHTLMSEDGLNQLAGEGLGDSCVYYDTILDNPIEGYRFNGDNTLDPLDFIFPCEESLIQPIIDLCIKEIAAISGIPRDAVNNATDDLSLPKQ